MGLSLTWIAGHHAIARLPPDAGVPDWAFGPGFASVTRTGTELSILCREERMPAGLPAERGWRGLSLDGPFAFDATGIAAAVLAPLAEAGIPVLMIASHDTDTLFVKADRAAQAAATLQAAGHRLSGPPEAPGPPETPGA